MKKIFSVISLLAIAFGWSCQPKEVALTPVSNSVIYEMNVRQSTPEGTFAAAEAQLPGLKELGVDIIWLMPYSPIGVLNRKGTLGSYYAIRDYYDVNEEFGGMEQFDSFLSKAHSLGLRVVMDFVGNHTSPDCAWVTEKPAEWYVRDENGVPAVMYDWVDIAELNYECEDCFNQMKDVLHFWADKGIDGFRCDAAMEVPDNFWKEVLSELRSEHPGIYLLAEAEGEKFHEDGFEATYAWKLHHIMNEIAQGKMTAKDIITYVDEDYTKTVPGAMKMMFITNHDENSWAGTEFDRMGDAVLPLMTLCYTLPYSQPLIYTGQQIGFNHRFEFFEKDPITDWTPNKYTEYYKAMNDMKHRHPALDAFSEYTWIPANNDNVIAFVRQNGDDAVMVVCNLSNETAVLDIDPATYNTIIEGAELPVSLSAWGYSIIEKKP